MDWSDTTSLVRTDLAERADVLNVAAVCPSTRSLGPGVRSVIWVQGCFFRCPGCIAPGWIPIQPARMVPLDKLVEELLVDPAVTGLTFLWRRTDAASSRISAVRAVSQTGAPFEYYMFQRVYPVPLAARSAWTGRG